MTISKFTNYLIIILSIYSCSPINKQHGYLMDDFLYSSDQIANFEVGKTTNNEIFSAMGSPSIEIADINNVWIYLISIKEKKVFDDDTLLFQNVVRFEFNKQGSLLNKAILTQDDFKNISFASEITKVDRNAYSITDQLYDAFTRGQ